MAKNLKLVATAFRRPARGARSDLQLLSGKELRRPGAQLINLILTLANERGLSMEETAREALGVSRSHFNSLRNGGKEIPQLGEEHISKAARFLGICRVAAKVAAGQLPPEDFYTEPDVVRDYLRPAMRYIQSDPDFAPFIPATIVDLPADLQLAFVMVYERATGRSLIPGRVSPEEIAKRHRELPQGSE
jgi:hypothetical protein